MKKLVGFFMALFGIAFLFLTPTTVKADEYSIEKYRVNVDVLKDGDAQITQKITYDFQGDFHGVYYNQDLRGIKGAGDPEVFVDIGGGDKKLTPSDSGKNNTFKVTRTKDAMRMKVYHTVDSALITFTYKYKLLGVITNYRDTAELNWKIIGNGWDNELNDIKLNINFPDQNISQLRAWTHGPLNGYTKVDRKKGRVVITLDELAENTSVESHIIFPTAVTSANKNFVDADRKASIMNDEKKLAQEANAKRRQKSVIYGVLMAIGVLLILGIYWYQYIKIKKHPGNKHRIPTPLHHFFDEPPFAPSFTKVLLDKSKQADSLSLTADLLNEAGYGRMKIDKIGKDFKVTALKPVTNEFYKYLFETIGDGTSFRLKQIRSYVKKNNDEVDDKFNKWADDAASGREKYLDLKNLAIVKNFRGAVVGIDIIIVIMFVISMLLSNHLAISLTTLLVLGVIAWIPYFFVKKQITAYTDQGEIEINQIRAFKRMLEDIDDIKMAEVGDLILWERFLPYAVVFGVSDRVIKALRINFGVEAVNGSGIMLYYVGSNSFASRHNQGFQSAFTGALGAGGSSSISGGSGGFSGGSSGGFGGGSGGGAF